jgi:two-component system, sensor histidine kinase and response regulator
MKNKIILLLLGKANKTFEERTFIYANVISMLVCVFASISNFANHIFFKANFFIAFAFLVYLSLFFYTRKNNLRSFSYLIYLLVSVVVLSISWFLGGGIDSPVIGFYFLMMLVAIFLSKPQHQILSGTVVFLGLLFNMFVEYLYPRLVVRYPDPLTEFYDITYISILNLAFIGLLTYVFKRNYDRERSHAESKNDVLLKLTQKIKQQNEQLALANQTKDKMFSIISHDLRAPVAALRNTLDILDPQMLDADELAFVKKELSNQFSSMDFTLNNLLIWAKSQLKGEKIHPEAINLAHLMAR